MNPSKTEDETLTLNTTTPNKKRKLKSKKKKTTSVLPQDYENLFKNGWEYHLYAAVALARKSDLNFIEGPDNTCFFARSRQRLPRYARPDKLDEDWSNKVNGATKGKTVEEKEAKAKAYAQQCKLSTYVTINKSGDGNAEMQITHAVMALKDLELFKKFVKNMADIEKEEEDPLAPINENTWVVYHRCHQGERYKGEKKKGTKLTCINPDHLDITTQSFNTKQTSCSITGRPACTHCNYQPLDPCECTKKTNPVTNKPLLSCIQSQPPPSKLDRAYERIAELEKKIAILEEQLAAATHKF